MSASTRLPRLVGAAGTAWGVLLLVRGDQVWRRVEHRPPSEVEDLAIRTLGVRHLVQGVAQVVAPRATGTAVVAVDLVHAATMAALAAASPQRRRAALVTGSVALASAGLTRLSRAGHP